MAVAPELETALHAILLRAAAARMPLAEVRAFYINAALTLSAGNKSHAAQLIQIDRRTISRTPPPRQSAAAAQPQKETACLSDSPDSSPC